MLNPELDAAELARAYAVNKRLRIDDILLEPEAQKLYECLRTELPWDLVFQEGERSVTLQREALERMSPAERGVLMQRVYRQAATQFQYLYFSCSDKDNPRWDLHRLLEYVNTDEFLGFVRTVTGEPDLRSASGHAARYGPGHFLIKHDDTYGNESRRVAYVFNFSWGWHSGWGGLLHFIDDRDRVVESHVPGFNSLVLFNVPAMHAVSVVAPFAQGSRYSVTGWFMV